MITDAFLAIVFGIADAFMFMIGLLPIPAVEDSLGAMFTDMGFIFGHMAAMGSWIPFDVAGPAIVFLYLAAMSIFSIRIMRVLISLFTGGGGSAG